MNEKLLVSAFLCFFVFSLGSVAQEEKDEKYKILEAEKENSRNIIYVDDEIGDDGKGDGSEKKPFKTINKALSAAVSGDKIIVGPGNYDEFLSVDIDNIIIEGSGSGSTTIDAAAFGHCSFARITGFSISGEWGLSFQHVGTAMVVDCHVNNGPLDVGFNSTAWISDSQIRDSYDVGVWFQRSSNGQLVNCKISGNEGGGVSASYNSFLMLDGCEIWDNSYSGVTAGHNSQIRMGDCLIHDNRAKGILAQRGGVVSCRWGTGEERKNYIYGNKEAGIEVMDGGQIFLHNTEIYLNENYGISAHKAALLRLQRGVYIHDHEIGVSVTEYAHGFIEDANITGNGLDVKIINGHVMCDSTNIGTIRSNCPTCPSK